MLAGKKLLLADDSVTIQKVVDLTFADEGVTVLTVNNGREAIEKLFEFAPDVVLADVFMPQMGGLAVCEHIKQNDQFKHIPVMLLVGSFEPFDEREARRVGADDILTKPFQSIRNLIDKVGVLVSGRAPEEQIPTKELPHPHEPAPAPEKLSEEELQVTTADTLPLPDDQRHIVEHYAARQEARAASHQNMDETVETKLPETEAKPANTDELLDLSGMQASGVQLDDDFVLDLDLDEPAEPSPAVPAYSAPLFQRRSRVGMDGLFSTATVDRFADTHESIRPDQLSAERAAESLAHDTAPIQAQVATEHVPSMAAQSSSNQADAGAMITSEQLSPELIDMIARRAVAQLSEKVVQEIAWEVVPQLAELMIKRQLEDKNS